MDKLTPPHGFSTLEMLIAMAILVTSFSAVILLSSSQSLTVDSQVATEALSVARQSLETEQSLGRKDFTLVVATSSANAIKGIESSLVVRVVQKDAFTKQVTSTVSWKGTYGRLQNIELSTLVTNFGNAVGGDTCSSTLADSAGAHTNWKAPVTAGAFLATIVGDTTGNAQYPITSVDAYQRRLYVGVSTTTAPIGPNNPITGTDNNAVGAVVWANPSRITAKDASVATLALAGTNISHYLKATNFGFAIPPGATITGIKVDVYRSASGQTASNAAVDSQVKLVKADGTITALNKASGTQWGTSITGASYGGSTDFWGQSDWTPTKINDSNFGVVLAVTGSSVSANRTANVDSIQVTIYYTKAFYILKNPADTAAPSAPQFLGGLATTSISAGITALAVATSSIGNYVYAATAATGGLNQLQVIDVTNPAAPFVKSTYPTLAGTGMGQGVGNSIFYKDGYAYVGLTKSGTGPEFNVIDVSTPTVPLWKGGYNVGQFVNDIVVKDGYAYITTNDPTKELVVLNVTNPANPTFVGSYNASPDITNFGYGRALTLSGDTLYMGRSWTNSGSIPQLLTLDVTSLPATLGLTKSLGTNMSMNGLVVRDYLSFVLVGGQTSGGALQVLSATTTAQWGTAATNVSFGTTGIGGVSLDCEGNYLYTASIDSQNRGTITVITGQ